MSIEAALVEEILDEAIELLKLVSVQDHGRKHNWAGMWSDCQTCKEAFAYSWNWSQDPEDGPPNDCPFCRARRFLKGLKG